jgi:hypothetical protein
MGYHYNTVNHTFNLWPPINLIAETEYGNDLNAHIIYPRVSSCTAITLLLAGGSALGAHFSSLESGAEVDVILAQMNTARAGVAVNAIYLVGKLSSIESGGWKTTHRYAWPNQKATFNTTFGRPAGALIYGYDQPEQELDYRALIGAGAVVAWATRRTAHGAAPITPWTNLVTAAV